MKLRTTLKRAAVLFAIALNFGVAASSANAAIIYYVRDVTGVDWTDTTADATPTVSAWSTTSNGLTLPVTSPGIDDTIIYAASTASGTTSVELEGNQSIFRIEIPYAGGNSNIRGGTTQTTAAPILSLGTGGIDRTGGGSGVTSIGSVTAASLPENNVIVELTGSQTWKNNGSNTNGIFQVDGPVRVSSSLTNSNLVLTLDGTNTGFNRFTGGAGQIAASAVGPFSGGGLSDGTGSGNSLSIVKTGDGTWSITVAPATTPNDVTGTHTYSGGTTIFQGILSVNGTSSTPASGVVTSGPLGTGVLTMDGGTLLGSSTIVASAGTNNSLANSITLNATSNKFSVINGTSPTPATAKSVTNLNGVIGGAGGFTKIGSGELVLSNTNAYAGSTTVNSGLLNVTGSIVNNGLGANGVFINAIDNDFANATKAVLTRDITDLGNDYAGVGSTSVGGLGTNAQLLFGTNSAGGSETVTMEWRTQNGAVEADLLISNILELSGMTNGSSSTDLFVLQMSYDGSVSSDTEELALATAGVLNLSWLDTNDLSQGPSGTWKNSVLGNSDAGAGQLFVGDGAWTNTPANTTLSHWGIDTASNVVWAVLDHNSQFAVVPEPSNFALAGVGLAGLGVATRRKRRA